MWLKTVEIFAEEKLCRTSLRHHDTDIVSVTVPYAENALRESLKAAGGRRESEKDLRRVHYGAIRSNAGLVGRKAGE